VSEDTISDRMLAEYAEAASIFLRVLIATTQLLGELPCNEQGYPSDTVSWVAILIIRDTMA
jgi:hypothetical protein